MNEDFLHYVWKFQRLRTQKLTTSEGVPIQVLQVGHHNYNAGPDFFNGQLIIGNQKWAGTIEIHVHSSDWYIHNHEKDKAYDTVILHVVWQHDAEVYRKNGSQIPTLVLQDYISSEMLANYRALYSQKTKWIVCEDYFPKVASFTLNSWLERLYIERLEQKSTTISERLIALQNDWEAVFFEMLAKSFGLVVNGASFLSIAQSIPFILIQKYRHNPDQLEALLFGQAGFLDVEAKDVYQLNQQQSYGYIKQKHGLKKSGVAVPKYFRLRPHNFPNIRLSQLANLYFERSHLFSSAIEATSVEQLYKLFNVSALPYWETHYSFGVTAASYKRTTSKAFIDLLLINTIIPIKFCYAQKMRHDNVEELLAMARSLTKENNTIINRFNALKKVAINAFDSQALLQLNKYYCSKLKCMQCAIGNEILRR